MTTDVLVIGGGPAGAAAATQLARGGAQVTLVERDRISSHKVCGEFLSVEALQSLRMLEIDPARLGAIPLETVRFTHGAGATEQPLPFAAMSLTRRCLDDALLRHAESTGVKVMRGSPVERLFPTGTTWQATLRESESITARTIFLASGKHDLRGHPRPAHGRHGMVAFKMYWRLSKAETSALGRSVELIPYPGGYAGLQPVEGGLVNLCCLIQASHLRRLGGGWDRLLAHMRRQSPYLHRRLVDAQPQLPQPLTISPIPYGFVRKNSTGIWYLGDQAVVIPSFTGDGMSLALHTGMLAADMYLRGESPDRYQRIIAEHVRRQVAIATSVSSAIVHIPRLSAGIARFFPGVIDLIAKQTRIDPAHRTPNTAQP